MKNEIIQFKTFSNCLKKLIIPRSFEITIIKRATFLHLFQFFRRCLLKHFKDERECLIS